jgi:hypothetical protein
MRPMRNHARKGPVACIALVFVVGLGAVGCAGSSASVPTLQCPPGVICSAQVKDQAAANAACKQQAALAQQLRKLGFTPGSGMIIQFQYGQAETLCSVSIPSGTSTSSGASASSTSATSPGTSTSSGASASSTSATSQASGAYYGPNCGQPGLGAEGYSMCQRTSGESCPARFIPKTASDGTDYCLKQQ